MQEKDEFTGNESDQYNHVEPCHWINADGSLSYYESMPLDMDKFYTFDRLIRNGAVGIDELQYFVEARTSGKYQNRVASYQIMQIRKLPIAFFTQFRIQPGSISALAGQPITNANALTYLPRVMIEGL